MPCPAQYNLSNQLQLQQYSDNEKIKRNRDITHLTHKQSTIISIGLKHRCFKRDLLPYVFHSNIPIDIFAPNFTVENRKLGAARSSCSPNIFHCHVEVVEVVEVVKHLLNQHPLTDKLGDAIASHLKETITHSLTH